MAPGNRVLPDIKLRRGKREITYNTANMWRRVFERIDKNKDGIIDLDELKLEFKDLIGAKTIETLFKEYDSDKNNKIDLSEFIKLLTPAGVHIPQDIFSSFALRNN